MALQLTSDTGRTPVGPLDVAGGATPRLADLLRATSRTFAIGIEGLPGALREAVRTSYLLLRVSDYLEDHEQLPPESKATLLALWDEILAGGRDVAELERCLADVPACGPDAVVAHHARAVVAALHALPGAHRVCVVRHVRDSTRGMARWAARGPRFATEDDLDDYMHEVAGRVGWLLTDLFAAHSRPVRRRAERLLPLAREFGLGLQTVNVIRGLPADRVRGWIFVPDTMTADLGVRAEQLFDPAHAGAARAVLGRLADKAERHLREAERYVTVLPRHGHRLRVFCLLPLFFAVATLRVTRFDPEVFREERKLGRDEVRRIVADTERWGWSNAWVARYCERLRGRPDAGARLDA